MLSKLLDKFVAERTAVENEENNQNHAYELLMQDLQSQIRQAEKDRDSKAQTKAKKLQGKADASGSGHDTFEIQQDDEKYLSDLTATCEQKATDFQNGQQLRADELDAIDQAIEIIDSGAVAGNADKHLPGLTQLHTAPSFGQLRANMQSQVRVRA